jgi:LysM repeat protein
MPFSRQAILLFFSIFSFTLFAQNQEANASFVPDSLNFTPKITALSDSVINYGKLYLNAPYRYGSPGSESFDCSGFTSFVYRNFGYDLKRSSADQAEQFPRVEKSQLQKGDLVFFEGRRHNKRVGHVGMVVASRDNGEFDFIHASTNHGVIISNSEEPYYLKRYVKAGRVIGSDTTARIADSNSFLNHQEYVSSVPSQTVTRTIPAVFHKVKKGENLSVISEKFGISVAQLKQKNHLKSSSLKPNQRLLIKEEQSYDVIAAIDQQSESASNSTTFGNSENKSDSIQRGKKTTPEKHDVKKGETLISIAHLYNISVTDLRLLNNLPNGKIYVGQELKVKKPENMAKTVEPVPNSTNKIPEVKEEKIPAKNIVSGQLAKHTVKPGETLIAISQKYNMTVEELKSVNNLPNGKILVGQELTVFKPEKSASTVEPAPIAAEKTTEEKETKVPKKTITPEMAARHKVKKGETLTSIAQKYNMTVEDLKEANDLQNGRILVGQELTVLKPEKSASTVEPAPIVAEKTTEAKETKVPKKTIAPEMTARHKVKKGETLTSIAQKYNMTVEELKEANDLQNGRILVGQELTVLKPEKSVSTVEPAPIAAEKTTEVKETKVPKKTIAPEMAARHKVKKGETLTSIAQKYNMTVDDLKEANDLQNGKILIGEELTVLKPAISSKVTTEQSSKTPAGSFIRYKVKPGESLFTIAKSQGVTIDELKEWNDLSESKIVVGQILNIEKSSRKINTTTVHTKNNNVYVGHTFSIHDVKKGESVYTLAQMYNVSSEEIIAANQLKSTELAIGQRLKIPVLKNRETKNPE